MDLGRSPRRWPWGVLSIVAVLCSGVVAVPVAWAVRLQAKQEHGEVSPDAAVNVYVLQFSAGEEIGLPRVLAGDRRDELLEQWRTYQVEMRRAERPSKLELAGPIGVEVQGDDRALVTTQVQAVWQGAAGTGLSIAGEPHPWRFEARRDWGGWRIWSAELPAWCGVHVRVDRCR